MSWEEVVVVVVKPDEVFMPQEVCSQKEMKSEGLHTFKGYLTGNWTTISVRGDAGNYQCRTSELVALYCSSVDPTSPRATRTKLTTTVEGFCGRSWDTHLT